MQQARLSYALELPLHRQAANTFIVSEQPHLLSRAGKLPRVRGTSA